MLLVVISALVLTLGYPTQRFLGQRAEIAEIERSQAAQRERIAALEERKRQWDDPAYVKAQARRRLQYVTPGEVAYVIVDEHGKPVGGTGAPGTGEADDDGTWYARLWSSVEAADRPAPAGR